jgi:adenylate cyclase
MSLDRIRGLRAEGASARTLAEANLDATRTSSGPVALLAALLPVHLLLARARVRERRMRLADDTVRGCVGFVDLVGSTTLSRRLSPRELAAFVDRFEEVASAVATRFGGRVVKFIGDEVMVVTARPGAACDIALTLIERFEGDGAVTPRGGIACGALLDRSGDYYGPVVNLAARLAELAVAREVLLSTDAVADLDPGRFRSEPAGRRALRGFDEPVAVASVVRA